MICCIGLAYAGVMIGVVIIAALISMKLAIFILLPFCEQLTAESASNLNSTAGKTNIHQHFDSSINVTNNTNNNSIICAICTEHVNEPLIHECGNLFCKSCLHEYHTVTVSSNTRKTLKCPLCRQPLILKGSKIN